MKLSMVVTPPTETRLRTLRQLGGDYAVHYDMHDLPDDLHALRAIRDGYERAGLPWKVSESGPAIDRIVLGKEGAAQQTERYKRIIGSLGTLGVEVVAYNFMPQVSEDAMVVRTTFNAEARGRARTSGFRLADVGPLTLPHNEASVPREQMWDNLERFLAAVIPAAEAVCGSPCIPTIRRCPRSAGSSGSWTGSRASIVSSPSRPARPTR